MKKADAVIIGFGKGGKTLRGKYGHSGGEIRQNVWRDLY